MRISILNTIIKNKFFKKKYSLLLIFSLLIIGDTLTKFFLQDTGFSHAWFFKFIISILLVVNLLVLDLNTFIKIFFLFFIVSLGMVFNYQNDFIAKISLFFEYISGILFFRYLVFNNNKFFLNKILHVIFIYYTLSIIIVAIFDVSFFKTYGVNRFGYMPVFSSQNEFSFIMIAIVLYFYKKYIKIKTKINLFIFSISLFSSLLIGTKIIYIFIFIFINALIISKLKRNVKLLFYSLSSLLIYLLKDNIYVFINEYFKPIVNVYKANGLLDSISSLRLSYLRDRLLCQISNFDSINYFFGGITIKCMTEMSIFDILLFFGIIGTIIYIYIYKIVIYDRLKLNYFWHFILIIITVLSFVGGYFFENLSSQFYLLSVVFLYCDLKK